MPPSSKMRIENTAATTSAPIQFSEVCPSYKSVIAGSQHFVQATILDAAASRIPMTPSQLFFRCCCVHRKSAFSPGKSSSEFVAQSSSGQADFEALQLWFLKSQSELASTMKFVILNSFDPFESSGICRSPIPFPDIGPMSPA